MGSNHSAARMVDTAPQVDKRCPLRRLRRRVFHKGARFIDKTICRGAIHASVTCFGPHVVALQPYSGISVVKRPRGSNAHAIVARTRAECFIAFAVNVDGLAIFDAFEAHAIVKEDGLLVAIAIGFSRAFRRVERPRTVLINRGIGIIVLDAIFLVVELARNEGHAIAERRGGNVSARYEFALGIYETRAFILGIHQAKPIAEHARLFVFGLDNPFARLVDIAPFFGIGVLRGERIIVHHAARQIVGASKIGKIGL